MVVRSDKNRGLLMKMEFVKKSLVRYKMDIFSVISDRNTSLTRFRF